MLNSTLTVNYNGTPYSVSRVNTSKAYAAEYFYRSALLDIQVLIGHTLPVNNKNESHIVTLIATTYDAEGIVTNVEHAYERVVTKVGNQNSTTMGYLDAALRDFMATNATAIFERES